MDKQQIETIAQQLDDALDQMKQVHVEKQNGHCLKPSERHFLYLISIFKRNQTVAPSDIANKLGVTFGAITHHLKALEADGYVKRTVSTNDRRSIVITLTAKGSQAAEDMRQEKMQQMHELIEYLGLEDSQNLARIATKMSDYIKTKSEDGNNA